MSSCLRSTAAVVASASMADYFQLIEKFTVHSFIYKDEIFLAYSLLRVPFDVVLICELPTDSTVVIGKTTITNEHTRRTQCKLTCIH